MTSTQKEKAFLIVARRRNSARGEIILGYPPDDRMGASGVARSMPEFRFDPPLTLKGNIVVRNLDDAVRFMIGYREARRPELQTSVLHRLERGWRSRGTCCRRCILRLGRGRAPLKKFGE
jgi:hypothetical protein